MASPDTKQGEKEYLRRTSAGAWERFKPFSPPGTHTLDDSAALMQDFAVAIRHLPPRPSDFILDLGAGACWCSDWLQRLNFTTVAVDIAHDMLALGRTRLPAPETARLVAGDLELLPFASGSFDKAYCLSAIHHVPNIPKALGEVARVLKADGAALFSEPGFGHADKPTSVTAMQDFGVLEQDIVAVEFMDACTAAGFVDVRLKPMSYVIPSFGLTRDEWLAWQTHARTKRPARAIGKMWRGLLEFFGVGKRSVLFEEAFAMTLVRLLEGAMHDHPVIVARKSAPAAGVGTGHLARIDVTSAPARAARGTTMPVALLVTNTGDVPWIVEESVETGRVRLGVQWLDADRRLVNRDFHRVALGAPLAPGRSTALRFDCPVPDEPGPQHLKFDIVIEGVAWLEPKGSGVAVVPVDVG